MEDREDGGSEAVHLARTGSLRYISRQTKKGRVHEGGDNTFEIDFSVREQGRSSSVLVYLQGGQGTGGRGNDSRGRIEQMREHGT